VLVEGNFDVVSMHARAFPETCAALGTALTEAQARLLMRFTRRVILFYDGDRAGRAAARKAFDVLMEADMPEVLWAQLPDGQDPDDLARTEGTAGIARMLDSARPMLDILVDQIIGPAVGRDVATRTRAAEELGDVLSVVKNRLLREAATEDAARRLGFTPEQLVRAWRDRKQVTQRRSFELHPVEETEPTEDPVVAATLSRDHATLLLTLNDHPRLLDSAFREQIALLVDDTRFQSFLVEVAEEYVAGRIRMLQELFDGWDDQGLVKGMYAVLASADAMDAETATRTWEGITRRLKERWVNSELVRVTEALSQAQQSQPDAAILEALMNRSVSLMRYKRALTTGAGVVQ
jgi:DNA primase